MSPAIWAVISFFADDAGIPDQRSSVGKTNFYLFPFHEAEIYRYNDAEVMLTGVSKTLEEQLTMPDGQVRWIRTHKMPFRHADGRVIGVAGAYQHITEQKRLYERLRMEALAEEVSG